jgi:chemotaxis-related protein WspD
VTMKKDSTTCGTSPAETCWKTIGVMGDRSCGQLEAAVHCRNCQIFTEAGQKLFEGRPPDDYIQQQTNQLSEELAEEAVGAEAMMIFRIADEWLALNVGVVVEVAEPRSVHRIPHRSDRLLLGIVNIRGELQLCISLREQLGIQGIDQLSGPGREDAAPSSAAGAWSQPAAEFRSAQPVHRLLVVEREARRWAFVVEEVAGVHRIDNDRLSNVPSTVAKSTEMFSRAVFQWEGHCVGCLDDRRLFDSLRGSIG